MHQRSPSPALSSYSTLMATQSSNVAPAGLQAKTSHANTFVHKLYNMVLDNQYQHLISWSYTGSSFIVCNIMEFSRDVLPKHFKHNNFSSFVRQLNMYGFHKVNKSPRGHRTLAENQIWEFSHANFLKDRPELLDEIKRKAIESDSGRREASDLQSHMSMMQMTQSEMMQQISQLFESFSQVVKDLTEVKRRQTAQQNTLREMARIISQHSGGQLPPDLGLSLVEPISHEPAPPPIFITSHDPQQHTMERPPAGARHLAAIFHPDVYVPTEHMTALTVQTHNIGIRPGLSSGASSPSLSPGYGSGGSTLPPSPSPSMILSDDEGSLYSPHLPHTPRHSISSHTNSLVVDSMDPPSTPEPSLGHDSASSLAAFVHTHRDPYSRG